MKKFIIGLLSLVCTLTSGFALVGCKGENTENSSAQTLASSVELSSDSEQDSSIKESSSGDDSSSEKESLSGDDSSSEEETSSGDDSSSEEETSSGDDSSSEEETSSGDGSSSEEETSSGDDSSSEEHTHFWGEGIVTTEPKCEEIGVRTYTCTCGESKTEEIGALGHDEVEHAGQAATCMEKGWSAYETCSRCDYTTYVEILL